MQLGCGIMSFCWRTTCGRPANVLLKTLARLHNLSWRIWAYEDAGQAQKQPFNLPATPLDCYPQRMSTLSEIESAIEHLTGSERDALESRLISRLFGVGALVPTEREALLASLDEAEREIDSGQGLSEDALRRDVRKWAGR
jgi:hypothetical protein